MTSHRPALGAHVRREAGRELEATVLELVDLSLLGKQLHWCMSGPLFRTLRERLDELVECWRELADTTAERAVAIGYWPDGQADAVAAGADHTEVQRGPVDGQQVLSLLIQRLAGVAERTRERLERLEDLDVVSQDVLIDIVGELEQQLWMSRAQLPHGA